MKKIFTFALLAASVATASAADFVVYQNGALAADIACNSWWNVIQDTQASNPDGEGTVWSLTYNPNEPGGGATGPNFCAGLQAVEGSAVTGPLATATLTFKYYATTTCDITIRLDGNGVEENQVVTVTENDVNRWVEVSLDVADKFPRISTIWNEYKGNGLGDVMGVVVEKYNAETKVYFNDIIYTGINESWEKPEIEAPVVPVPPVPTQAAEDVISLLCGSYTPVTGFNIGGWGQSTVYKALTAENGAPVAAITNFNYLGWELSSHIDVTSCNYMHVDFYPSDATAFGFTPISPGAEKAYVASDVKVGEWNSYDVPLSYWDNVNFADIFQVKFDQGNGSGSGYIANVYFYKSGNTPVDPIDPDPVEPGTGAKFTDHVSDSYTQTTDAGEKTYSYDLTYTITFNEDRTLTVEAEYQWPDGAPVGIVGGSVFINNENNEFALTGDAETGSRSVTTTTTFQSGDDAAINFYIPVANGAVQTAATYKVGQTSGILDIETSDAPVEYYNLQGVKVSNPGTGIYICRQGNKVTKVLVK